MIENNEDLLKLCQLNALETCINDPEAEKGLQLRIARQAKIVINNIARKEDEEDDD